jgi:hypothetical protein
MSMLRKHRAASTFLIVGISIIFSIASVYSNYNCLLEADFLIRGVKFEAGDIDDLLVDKQITLDFIPSKFLAMGSLGKDLHRLLILSSLQIVYSGLPFSPLRC